MPGMGRDVVARKAECEKMVCCKRLPGDSRFCCDGDGDLTWNDLHEFDLLRLFSENSPGISHPVFYFSRLDRKN